MESHSSKSQNTLLYLGIKTNRHHFSIGIIRIGDLKNVLRRVISILITIDMNIRLVV